MNAPFPSRSSTVASGASAPPDAARALAEIVQRVAGSRDVDEVVDLITRRAAALLGGRASCLGLLDGDEIVVAARYGTELPRGPREPVAGSFAGEAILARAPVRTRDILADGTRWPWSARHAPGLAVNGIGAPLLIGDRAIGVITVFGREAGDFSADDESLLMALGHHAAVAIENARLLRSAERSVRHARLLATAARSLALNVTPRSMYADIGRLARSALGASGLAIYLADPAADSVELPYTEGVGADAAHLIVPRFWSALGGAAVRSGVAEFRREIRATSGEPEPVLKLLLDLGIESLALLPLLVEGRPRGLLVLRFTSRQAFDEEQRQLLLDFATHAAIALRNALLFADLEQRAARLTAVANVQQAISAAVAVEDVYAAIYNAVASVVDAPCFALLTYDEATGTLVRQHVVHNGLSVDPATLPRAPLGGGATSQAFRTGEPNIAARSRAGWSGTIHSVPGAADTAAVLSAPIIHGERVLGVMQAESYRHDAYDWNDLDLVMLIARQAGTALVNARLFETERREREQAELAAARARLVQERQRMLATALETLHQPVFVTSPDGVVLYANSAAEREYGYSHEEFTGMPVQRIVVADGPDAELWPTIDAGRAWAGERVHRHRDGTEFPAWVTVGAIRDEDGRAAMLVTSVRNLAEERRAAEQLRQSEKMVALGELVAGVAHEVNNPLTGISAFAQILAEEPLTPDQAEAVRLIKREADRAAGVIRDLLAFARKSGPRVGPIDLNAVVEQMLRLRAYAMRTAGITVTTALEPALRPVRGDDRQLQQVLLNLVVNAEHAMMGRDRRLLIVRSRNAGERVIVEIEDTGTGIRPEERGRIFEPFFTTKPEGAGTGLGLSVSYGIVRSHGGELQVESEPGRGSTFRIVLPAQRPAAADGGAGGAR